MPLTVSTKLCWYAHPFVWTNGMLAAISSRYLVGREWPTLKLLLDESPVKFRQIFCRTIVRTISQTCLKGKFARNLYNICYNYPLYICGVSVEKQGFPANCPVTITQPRPSVGISAQVSFFMCLFAAPWNLCWGAGVAFSHRAWCGWAAHLYAKVIQHWYEVVDS